MFAKCPLPSRLLLLISLFLFLPLSLATAAEIKFEEDIDQKPEEATPTVVEPNVKAGNQQAAIDDKNERSGIATGKPAPENKQAKMEDPLPSVGAEPSAYSAEAQLDLQEQARKAIEEGGYRISGLYREIDLDSDKIPELIYKVKRADTEDRRSERLAIFSKRKGASPFLFLHTAIHMEDLEHFEAIDFDRDRQKDLLLRDQSYRTCNTFVLHNKNGRFSDVFSTSFPGLCKTGTVPRFQQFLAAGALELLVYLPVKDATSCLEGYNEARLYQWNGRSFVDAGLKSGSFVREQKRRYREAVRKIDLRAGKISPQLSKRASLYIEYDCLLNAKKKYEKLLDNLNRR